MYSLTSLLASLAGSSEHLNTKVLLLTRQVVLTSTAQQRTRRGAEEEQPRRHGMLQHAAASFASVCHALTDSLLVLPAGSFDQYNAKAVMLTKLVVWAPAAEKRSRGEEERGRRGAEEKRNGGEEERRRRGTEEKRSGGGEEKRSIGAEKRRSGAPEVCLTVLAAAAGDEQWRGEEQRRGAEEGRRVAEETSSVAEEHQSRGAEEKRSTFEHLDWKPVQFLFSLSLALTPFLSSSLCAWQVLSTSPKAQLERLKSQGRSGERQGSSSECHGRPNTLQRSFTAGSTVQATPPACTLKVAVSPPPASTLHTSPPPFPWCYSGGPSLATNQDSRQQPGARQLIGARQHQDLLGTHCMHAFRPLVSSTAVLHSLLIASLSPPFYPSFPPSDCQALRFKWKMKVWYLAAVEGVMGIIPRVTVSCHPMLSPSPSAHACVPPLVSSIASLFIPPLPPLFSTPALPHSPRLPGSLLEACPATRCAWGWEGGSTAADLNRCHKGEYGVGLGLSTQVSYQFLPTHQFLLPCLSCPLPPSPCPLPASEWEHWSKGEGSPPSHSPPPLSFFPSLPAAPCLDHGGILPSVNPPIPRSPHFPAASGIISLCSVVVGRGKEAWGEGRGWVGGMGASGQFTF
ncbi:unnamed protein product [Closterium sp. NIES-65]|nr:unnamed protein product [Closterium sp. NIES-65]